MSIESLPLNPQDPGDAQPGGVLPAAEPLQAADPARPLGLLHRVGPLVFLVAFGFGIRRLITVLNRIPNSPEEFERLSDGLTAIIAGLSAAVIAGPIIGSRWAPFARAHRFAGKCIAAAILFWWFPFPFFIGRLVSLVLLYAIAGVYIAVCLRAALSPHRGGPVPPIGPWWSAAAAAASVLLSLLADKHNSLAFSVAID